MSYLDKLKAKIAEKQPDSGPTKPTEPGYVGSVSDQAGQSSGLPPSVIMGLHRLRNAPPPPVKDYDAWRGVVNDALRLKADGWAEKALALGWSVADLFGVGSQDSWDFSGLAVWLNGRRILALDEVTAIATDAAADRRYAFHRGGMGHGSHPAITPVMLWEFGRKESV